MSSSAFSQTRTQTTEEIIKNACLSKDSVLVIDEVGDDPTNTKIIDLDGDGIYDVFHGEFVKKLVELNNQNVIVQSIGSPIYPFQLNEIIKKYNDLLENKKINLSWINFSQGFTVDIDSLNKLLGLKDVVNDLNVHLFSRQILLKLAERKPELKIQELYLEFEKLQKFGVPFIVSAGNSGYKEVNIYSLFPGVISVGAIDLNGHKADYSADNSTVTVWRTGSILSYTDGNRLSFNNNLNIGFKLSTPLISAELIKKYNNKLASKVAQNIPEKIKNETDNNNSTFEEFIKKLPTGLYSTNEILELNLGTLFQQSRYIQSLGDYLYIDGAKKKVIFFAQIDQDGYLSIKQGQTLGSRQFRNTLFGTSFSSPSICNGEITPKEFEN